MYLRNWANRAIIYGVAFLFRFGPCLSPSWLALRRQLTAASLTPRGRSGGGRCAREQCYAWRCSGLLGLWSYPSDHGPHRRARSACASSRLIFLAVLLLAPQPDKM